MREKNCESCGMTMTAPRDFGGGNMENSYCHYCTDDHGQLKDYSIKLEETARFIQDRLQVDATVALEMAKEHMSKMPAWREVL